MCQGVPFAFSSVGLHRGFCSVKVGVFRFENRAEFDYVWLSVGSSDQQNLFWKGLDSKYPGLLWITSALQVTHIPTM